RITTAGYQGWRRSRRRCGKHTPSSLTRRAAFRPPFPITYLLAPVHQAVIQADHCAGLTDNAVARRVVLAPCAGTAVIAGAAVCGIGAAASVVGSGRGSRCDSTGANRCAGGRGPTRLPPGSARGRWIGQRVNHLCLRALDRQRNPLWFAPVKREQARTCEDGDGEGSFSETWLFHDTHSRVAP